MVWFLVGGGHKAFRVRVPGQGFRHKSLGAVGWPSLMMQQASILKVHAWVRAHSHTYTSACIHAYIHAYIHTYIRAHIHTVNE